MQNENNENQEKTKILYDLNDLENQIYEVENESPSEQPQPEENRPDMAFFMEPKEEKKKRKLKEKIKTWWQKRSKKQKITIIAGIILFVIALAIGIFFLVKSLNKEEEIIEKEDVIVEQENYRYENGKLIFLNKDKEEIGSYTCQNQTEELCFVSYYSNEDDFDIEKNVYEDTTPVIFRSGIINNNFVFINDNLNKNENKMVLYNIGEQKIEAAYTLIKPNGKNESRIILKNEEGKYGVLEFKEKEQVTKIDFKFDYLGFIENNTNAYISTQNGRNFLIDENGSNLSKAITGEIKNFNKNYVKVKNATGEYEVYNYNNQNTFGENFEYVELFDDYAILIKDNKIFLKYYDKNKLNEEGISLNNKDYVKTNVYNTENKLVTTKESFQVEEDNNRITINVLKEKEKTPITINKLEGNLNKSLKNINYFDGKLYIYRDGDKKDLLGSYTCANKNNITSNTTALTNCTLAEETVFEENDYEIPGAVGVIPVYNERFIFLSDNPDLVNDTNKTIVLYDLKKGSSLGKYAEISTHSYTGTKEITFATVGDLQVIAKNQSGRFGVIKIGLSEVTGHIGFNYSEMESLHDYYVAKDANGYLLLAKTNGASITSAIPYKIRNYNNSYVKVINDGNYYVYDLKGKQITKSGYKYIELYNDFFAAVDASNKLGIYSYSDTTDKNLLNMEVQLNLNTYYGNGTLAFKIDTSTKPYKIMVGTTNNTYNTIPIELETEA